MPNTTRGITYPDSGAHTRLWEHLQALATTADSAITAAINAAAQPDTSVAIPYASGWKASGSGTALRVRKIGKLCHIAGTITNTGNSIPVNAGGVDVATIPAGYLPDSAMRELFPIAPQNPGVTSARGYVTDTGAVRIYVYSAATAYVDFVCSYFTN